jgi:hypothetical protein
LGRLKKVGKCRTSPAQPQKVGAAAVELTPDHLRQIESAAARITVQGARYPEKLEQMTGL